MSRNVDYEILVFSDSHGDGALMRRALRLHPHADVIHLGDGLHDLTELDLTGRRVWTVMGNAEDFLSRFGAVPAEPTSTIVAAGGLRLYLTHGHREHVKSGFETAAYQAYAAGCDALLYGHTHERTDFFLPEGEKFCGETLTRTLHILNPGSASGYEASCALLTFRGGEMLSSFITDEY